MPTVRDVMSENPVVLEPTTTALTAAEAMKDHDIGVVIVAKYSEIVGILTDRDLVVRVVAEGHDPSLVTVDTVCTRNVHTLSPDDDIDEAARVMRDRAVRRIPIVESGHPVGIVSIGDLAVEVDRTSALADISAAAPNQ